jgi:hypothetical protein
MLLYRYGGVYIDTKATTMIPLREMIDPESRLTAFLDYVPNCIHNGFVAAEPNHPLIGRVIDRIVRNVQRGYYGECQLDITGPMVWGREFNLMLRQVGAIRVLRGVVPGPGRRSHRLLPHAPDAPGSHALRQRPLRQPVRPGILLGRQTASPRQLLGEVVHRKGLRKRNIKRGYR